jgi:arsenate reductase (thioredoxin)
MKLFRSKVAEKLILFVCIENAARSQMAEGFFRYFAPKGYQAFSAGTKPVSELNSLAVQVMREAGIDISHQKSKDITGDVIQNSAIIVNMGCIEKESCPTLFLHNLIDWNVDDPKGKSVDQVREIRDEIERRVEELVTSLKASQAILL